MRDKLVGDVNAIQERRTDSFALRRQDIEGRLPVAINAVLLQINNAISIILNIELIGNAREFDTNRIRLTNIAHRKRSVIAVENERILRQYHVINPNSINTIAVYRIDGIRNFAATVDGNEGGRNAASNAAGGVLIILDHLKTHRNHMIARDIVQNQTVSLQLTVCPVSIDKDQTDFVAVVRGKVDSERFAASYHIHSSIRHSPVRTSNDLHIILIHRKIGHNRLVATDVGQSIGSDGSYIFPIHQDRIHRVARIRKDGQCDAFTAHRHQRRNIDNAVLHAFH